MKAEGSTVRIIVEKFALLAILAGVLAADEAVAVAPEPGIWKHRIGPGDVLQIDVWKEPEASVAAVAVQSDGGVSVPILGEVKAAGLTAAEFQQTLAERFGEIIRGARVTVLVREVNSERVYLIGEVRREGPIRLQGPLTVLQALAEAGGITDYAKRKKIYVLRVVGGKKLLLPFDYGAVVRGDKSGQNVFLLPGDTVVVPR
jgi:polysaccharide export outer membrane protein